MTSTQTCGARSACTTCRRSTRLWIWRCRRRRRRTRRTGRATVPAAAGALLGLFQSQHPPLVSGDRSVVLDQPVEPYRAKPDPFDAHVPVFWAGWVVPVQVPVHIDRPGRWRCQRGVREHQGGTPARTAAAHMRSKPASPSILPRWTSWLPRTNRRRPGAARSLATSFGSQSPNGCATSPRPQHQVVGPHRPLPLFQHPVAHFPCVRMRSTPQPLRRGVPEVEVGPYPDPLGGVVDDLDVPTASQQCLDERFRRPSPSPADRRTRTSCAGSLRTGFSVPPGSSSTSVQPSSIPVSQCRTGHNCELTRPCRSRRLPWRAKTAFGCLASGSDPLLPSPQAVADRCGGPAANSRPVWRTPVLWLGNDAWHREIQSG